MRPMMQILPDTVTTTASIELQSIEALAAERVARDRWTREQLLRYQREKLPGVLRHAIAMSSYYRERIGSAVARGARLEDLPVLTKRTLMSEFDRIVTDGRVRLADIERHIASEKAGDLLLGEYRACATGGTSGERGVVVYDQQGWVSILANAIRLRRMYRDTKAGRFISITAPSPLHLSNRIAVALRFGASDIPLVTLTTPLPEIVDALNAYQPEYIFTYPSFIRRLAEEQQAGRLRIAPRKFRTGAETLTEDVRMLCLKTWGVEALDSYGTTEGGLMGGECQHAAGMHLTEDTAVFEVVDEANAPVPPGVMGSKLLLTMLTNRVLPLIRYEIADLLTVTEDICACGRPYKRIVAMEGRREEMLKLPARGGGHVDIHAGRLRSPLIRIGDIRQFQVAPQAGGLCIRIAIRDEKQRERVRSLVEQEVRHALSAAGAAVDNVAVVVVENIERVGTGAKEKLVSRLGYKPVREPVG